MRKKIYFLVIVCMIASGCTASQNESPHQNVSVNENTLVSSQKLSDEGFAGEMSLEGVVAIPDAPETPVQDNDWLAN